MRRRRKSLVDAAAEKLTTKTDHNGIGIRRFCLAEEDPVLGRGTH